MKYTMDCGLEYVKGQGLFSKNTGEPVCFNLSHRSQIGRLWLVGGATGQNSQADMVEAMATGEHLTDTHD